jgi:hypothetical protein
MRPRILSNHLLASLFLALGLIASVPAAEAQTGSSRSNDPRVGLRSGWMDAEQAAWNLQLISHTPRPAGFFNPNNMADFGFANTDMAFRDDLVFVGSYNGFQVFDISNPGNPTLRKGFVCPGGQGDLSVHGDLLFMSVEETRGRIDCGTQGVADSVSTERFRGVRIFDISNLDQPEQVAAVQTCRGSHTHTLVPHPSNPGIVYIYVSGTSVARSADELPGCSGPRPSDDPNTSYFRIEIIEVPLAAPQNARIVNAPRIFADPVTGEIAGLWPGGEHGPGTQRSAQTNQCHDITVYPAIGLAAGACSGNGILLDISDPANPVRIDEVVDPNFAYWHSATFDNEGETVIYTDEWGGGSAPRCRATDRPEWGANAIFRLRNRELEHASYYKLPAPQTAQENCVAHNGSLIPVPGRDIKVQAWYQGGISVFDFTDPENPVEIAFFDRGPMSPTELVLGGYWSAYWYNGRIYGSEIGRGLDALELEPNRHLTQNEIDAAKLVRFEVFNPQSQPRIEWPANFSVAYAYVDQLSRNTAVPLTWLGGVAAALDHAERLEGSARSQALRTLASRLQAESGSSGDPERVAGLASAVRALAR